ncbi:MAG: hypothetical protein ACSHW0_15850 [Thalassotalea sp.]
MRYLNKKKLRRVLKLDDLNEAKEHIKTLSAEERSKYIDDNGHLWTALRGEFWRFGDHKCWYSEAPLNEQCGQIEHFRPKKRLHGLAKGTKHIGYWWGAFDWENYRLASQVSNIRVTDYLSGKKVGKGSYFPLKEGTQRATKEAEENQYEKDNVVLLDPCCKSDIKLLTFSLDSGKPIPTIQPNNIDGKFLNKEDEWKNERAHKTIDYYHLDEGSWNTDRKDLMDEVAILCDQLIAERENNGKNAKYDELVDDLTEYLEKHEPFTSAVKQVLKEKSLIV